MKMLYLQVEGVNIIGLAPAISNKPGAVVVVGANYDSNTRDDPGPLFNNGAGIAALLETARLFMHNVKWSGAFKQNFTTIFVAFDLNTKEHDVRKPKPAPFELTFIVPFSCLQSYCI